MSRLYLAAVAVLFLLLGLGFVARATIDRNTLRAQPTPTVLLTFYATDNLGFLEFLDLVNATGPLILTSSQSTLLNTSQSYIILFTPYNASTVFEGWSVQGDAVLSHGDYMTNITVYTNTTLVAIASNPAIPTPEFPSGPLVALILALALVLNLLDGREAQVSSATRSPTPKGHPLLR